MNTTIEWDFERERPLSDFGEAYDGYYFDKDGVRYVGFGSVKPAYRGKGLFKKLNELLKESVRKVVIVSPSCPSVILLERQGYIYNKEDHTMVWERQRLGIMVDVGEIFR